MLTVDYCELINYFSFQLPNITDSYIVDCLEKCACLSCVFNCMTVHFVNYFYGTIQIQLKLYGHNQIALLCKLCTFCLDRAYFAKRRRQIEMTARLGRKLNKVEEKVQQE